jgi:integrase
MAAIRKRSLPSGKIAWLVDFKDANGRRRARQFATKRDADAFMIKARAAIATGSYVHETEAVTVLEAARAWLACCADRRDASRRMEKATFQDYSGKVRLHILDL